MLTAREDSRDSQENQQLLHYGTSQKRVKAVQSEAKMRSRLMEISRYSVLGAIVATIPVDPVAAHVNWFVDDPGDTLPNYAWSEPVFLGWLVVAALLVMFSVWLDAKLPNLRIVDTKTRHDFIEILRVFTGMSFLLTAYEGALIAPHHVMEGPLVTALLFLQAGIGILLIANRWLREAAVLMLVLHTGVLVTCGLAAALEYSIVVGIALFLLFNNFRDAGRRDRFKPYSVAALRIWTGVSLVALAIGEKLAPDALGQAFVAAHRWNFMEALGFELFDDRLFVLSAGMIEAVLGIVLILGTTVRLAVLALSVMMAISNVVFIVQGYNDAALVEFIGHMPIIGVALILLLLGYGQRLKVTNLFQADASAELTVRAEKADKRSVFDARPAKVTKN